MTEKTKQTAKKYGILAAVFLVFLGIICGLSYLNALLRKQPFISSAQRLCTACPQLQNKSIVIADFTKPARLGFLSRNVLSAKADGKEAWIFFIPMTGKYGIYSGIFFYEAGESCIFCGLDGKDQSVPADYYGITQNTIAMQKVKIEKMMKKYLR